MLKKWRRNFSWFYLLIATLFFWVIINQLYTAHRRLRRNTLGGTSQRKPSEIVIPPVCVLLLHLHQPLNAKPWTLLCYAISQICKFQCDIYTHVGNRVHERASVQMLRFHEAPTQRKACRENFLCDDDVAVTLAQFRLITHRITLIENFIRMFHTSCIANDCAKRVSEGHGVVLGTSSTERLCSLIQIKGYLPSSPRNCKF